MSIDSYSSPPSLKKMALSFLLTYKVYFISLVFVALLAGFFNISVDYKIKEIIDAIAADKHAPMALLLTLFVVYKLLFHGMYFIYRLLNIKYTPQIIGHTISTIYTDTVKHSLHWFDSHLSGEIASKLSDFQTGITTLISYCFQLLNVLVTLVVMLLFLFNTQALTALVLLGFVFIYIPVLYYLMKKQMRLQTSCSNARQKTLGIINDSISNIFSIKIIGDLLTEFKLKLMPAINEWKRWDKKTRRFDAFFVDNADTTLVVVMSAVQIYLLAYLYQTGNITAGGFAFVAMMTLKINDVLDRFVESLLFNINPSLAQIKSSYAFVNTPVEVKDAPNAIDLASVKGAIHYKEVDFSYKKNGKKVLSDFNLVIKPGERLGLVGLSGAGKTTLIKCLLRYFDVRGGSIIIDGHDIRDISQASLRKAITIIPQDITLFHRTVRENLKLARYEATDEEMINACKKAKIHDDIMQMSKGYDTVVGERGVKLSGGQRQRVAIARAILKESKILILDEATSSLDTPTEQAIQASIETLLNTSRSTVIAIAHRLSTLKHMDRIIVLEKGAIVEEGTHHGLIRKKGGYYKNLWDKQAIAAPSA